MSDETTLLQSLSKLKKAGKLRYWRGTIEMPESELHAICDEIQAEHDQAIAATLGSEREKQLESLARDMFAYIDKCCESDLSFGCVDPVDCAYYDKARDWCTKASSLKQRMKELGIGVIDE